MSQKLQELVENLLAGTQTGILKWTDTPEKGVYRLMLDKGFVRIYRLGPTSSGDNFVGCIVLNPDGDLLEEVEIPQTDDGPLVTLYDLVDSNYQSSLDDLLTEIRMKMQDSHQPASVGQP